jgi:hypothetical protein
MKGQAGAPNWHIFARDISSEVRNLLSDMGGPCSTTHRLQRRVIPLECHKMRMPKVSNQVLVVLGVWINKGIKLGYQLHIVRDTAMIEGKAMMPSGERVGTSFTR